MSLSLGNAIQVSTNFIKSNPAVPVYNGEENLNNLYAVIYHIEIGYSEVASQKTKQYIIIDYKEFNLNIDKKEWPYRSLFNTICIKKDADFYVYNL